MRFWTKPSFFWAASPIFGWTKLGVWRTSDLRLAGGWTKAGVRSRGGGERRASDRARDRSQRAAEVSSSPPADLRRTANSVAKNPSFSGRSAAVLAYSRIFDRGSSWYRKRCGLGFEAQARGRVVRGAQSTGRKPNGLVTMLPDEAWAQDGDKDWENDPWEKRGGR